LEWKQRTIPAITCLFLALIYHESISDMNLMMILFYPQIITGDENPGFLNHAINSVNVPDATSKIFFPRECSRGSLHQCITFPLLARIQ
jgi:hypothetical protein